MGNSPSTYEAWRRAAKAAQQLVDDLQEIQQANRAAMIDRQMGKYADEPDCNHDAVAVRNGVCECGYHAEEKDAEIEADVARLRSQLLNKEVAGNHSYQIADPPPVFTWQLYLGASGDGLVNYEGATAVLDSRHTGYTITPGQGSWEAVVESCVVITVTGNEDEVEATARFLADECDQTCVGVVKVGPEMRLIYGGVA